MGGSVEGGGGGDNSQVDGIACSAAAGGRGALPSCLWLPAIIIHTIYNKIISIINLMAYHLKWGKTKYHLQDEGIDKK